jgi:hypothetical protein
MLGSEFPLQLGKDAAKRDTTFAELLFGKISGEISQFTRLPQFYDKTFAQKDLCQLARDFIFYNENNQVKSRGDLEILISDYFDELTREISSESFNQLSALPFYFIVDTNYGNGFYELLKRNGKKPKKDYYNYKGAQVPVSNIMAGKRIGTEEEPFVYNLYGSVAETKSMAISDYDLILLLNNIISKTPGLPADVRAELAHEETCILFMGFGILPKNWYFRILLHALTSGNKKTMSYALEYLSNIQYDQDPTVLFFKDELNVCLYNYDPKQFISDLVTRYQAFSQKQDEQGGGAPLAISRREQGNEEVKVFISYKREDQKAVTKLVQVLESKYMTVLWDQSDDFTGNWKKRIEDMIESSDVFILMQSEELKTAPVNYVNFEIRLAMEKAKTYLREDGYLYPAYIDSKSSMLMDSDFEFIKEINNWDLSTIENLDNMCKQIIRNKVRNKKNIAI